MKFYKKSFTAGWHVILLGAALLAFLIVAAIIILQSEGPLSYYVGKISDTIFT